MPIDYGRLISRTWEVFSRNRVLWVLGLISALAASWSVIFNINSQAFQRYFTNFSTNPQPDFFSNFWEVWGGYILGTTCLAFILGFIFSIVQAAADAALIASTDRIDAAHEQLVLGTAWSLGWRKVIPMWLLNLLVGIISIFLVLIAVVPFVFFVISAIAGSDSSGNGSGIAGLGVLGCLCGCVLLILAIPIGIALSLTREFAMRAIVLDNQGVFEALRTGWRMLRENLGPAIVTLLITVVVGIVASVVSTPIGLLFAGPFAASVRFDRAGQDNIAAPALVIWAILFAVLSAIIQALFSTFDSVLWTELYRNRRQMPNSDFAPGGMMPPMTPGGPNYGNPYGTGYGAPPSYPPPYTPPAPGGAPPPYTPPGTGSAPPSYSPPTGSPPPYTPPPPASGMGYTPPSGPPGAAPDTLQYGSLYSPPPAPPPASGMGYTPPSGPLGTAPDTIQYGSPYSPPPAPPPASDATQVMWPSPPDSGPPTPPDDRARGPEGTTGGQ